MKIANRYEVIKEIGNGGMANVYLALDTILNREVAIKVLKSDMADDPVSLERFKREANASTKLSHPNAVDVYDVGDDGKLHYIVMEYVKGHTLKQLIKRRGALPPKEAVWIMKQLTGALLEAHKNGIIHRDIKSQNVLIKDDGTVKLADFGIAVLNNAMQITSKGSVLGSVHYLAPEIAKGANASMQSDIYSLGIVFYELLTGDVPYKADTPVGVALEHVRNNVPYVRDFNPDIPESVSNIVIKATARSLNERYENVALMLRDLNRCLKPEAKNDKRLVLNYSNNSTYKTVQEDNRTKIIEQKEKEEKTSNRISAFFIVIVSIVSLGAIFFILFMTGVIGNGKNKYVTMPDVSNLTLTAAEDVLSEIGLSIDSSNIEWVLTEDKELNTVVSTIPKANSQVERGSKVSVTVSEGTYGTIENYVGQNFDTVKKALEAKKFKVLGEAVESDQTAGIIISQSLKVGETYNPNVTNTIKFTYAASNSIYLDFSFQNRDVDTVLSELESQGFSVIKSTIALDLLTASEKACNPNTVVKTEPALGSWYTQSDNSSIILYYFESNSTNDNTNNSTGE